eukprot:TRINITY_DN11830_c0_g1_i1.p1 TRINITY_DN11830_c0_g1~~TRINITY_DN11830_c0_g1_i1.p1  ORF type:complete len:113 (-),score=36.89 TRINITY_DN11830_c0_g1_i1:996-1334(-)
MKAEDVLAEQQMANETIKMMVNQISNSLLIGYGNGITQNTSIQANLPDSCFEYTVLSDVKNTFTEESIADMKKRCDNLYESLLHAKPFGPYHNYSQSKDFNNEFHIDMFTKK